ncbi:MAG: hypothetical protein ACK2UO_08490, partial [Caldilineaceae bacterium]
MTEQIDSAIGHSHSIAEDELVQGEERVSVASQWQLTWWKFRKHKLAMAGGIVTILIYLVAL